MLGGDEKVAEGERRRIREMIDFQRIEITYLR
jgi:hypothetical protein